MSAPCIITEVDSMSSPARPLPLHCRNWLSAGIAPDLICPRQPKRQATNLQSRQEPSSTYHVRHRRHSEITNHHNNMKNMRITNHLPPHENTFKRNGAGRSPRTDPETNQFT
jgi:hypothetical protein